MSERSAAIGLASTSSGLPPPNSSACGLEMNDQVTASTRPRAASARLALRVRICSGVSTGLRGEFAAIERRHRHAVDADDAHDLLDDVGLAVHVGAPGRHRDVDHRAGAGDQEAEMAEHALHLRQRQSMPASRLTSSSGKSIDPLAAMAAAAHHVISDGVPPQSSSTMRVASSRPGTMKAGSTPRSKR